MKYKFTIKTGRANDMDQYGSREIVTCIYVPECKHFDDAMQKARRFALYQLDDEDCDSIISVEVVRYEENA